MIHWWNPVSVVGKCWGVAVPLTDWRVQAYLKGSVTTQLQLTLAMEEYGWPSVFRLPVLQKKPKSGFQVKYPNFKILAHFKKHIPQIKYICGPDATSYYSFFNFISVLYCTAFAFLPCSKYRYHLYNGRPENPAQVIYYKMSFPSWSRPTRYPEEDLTIQLRIPTYPSNS